MQNCLAPSAKLSRPKCRSVLACFWRLRHVAWSKNAICSHFAQELSSCWDGRPFGLIFTWWGLTRLDDQTESASGVYWTASMYKLILVPTSNTYLSHPNINSPLHHIRWKWNLKLLTDGAHTTEFSKLFHQLITLSENAVADSYYFSSFSISNRD